MSSKKNLTPDDEICFMDALVFKISGKAFKVERKDVYRMGNLP